MTSGAHDDTTIALATWATGHPATQAELVDKFKAQVEPVAGVRASDDLLAVLADLDALRTLAPMFDALRVLNPAS
jgi:hypothetical protein